MHSGLAGASGACPIPGAPGFLEVRGEIVLAGEGCGEAWLPYLDLMLTLQVSRERYSPPNDPWEVIPFFQAVYHPYAVTYGSYSSLTMPPYDEPRIETRSRPKCSRSASRSSMLFSSVHESGSASRLRPEPRWSM